MCTTNIASHAGHIHAHMIVQVACFVEFSNQIIDGSNACICLFNRIDHFVMQYVVIPLSAIGNRPGSEPLGSLLNSVIGHAVLVGLPVALIARWSAGRRN